MNDGQKDAIDAIRHMAVAMENTIIAMNSKLAARIYYEDAERSLSAALMKIDDCKKGIKND